MKPVFACLMLLVAATSAAAQDGTPRFEDYPAGAAYTGPRKPPVLATREERLYRTQLREAAKGKPNFAGHYVVTTWGCGTECQSFAVIDVRTGRVLMLPFTLCCWSDDVGDDDEPIVYHVDSMLLVFRGVRSEDESDMGTHYYALRNGRLVELKAVKKAA